MRIQINLSRHELTCVDVVEAIQRSRLNARDMTPFQENETGVLRDINGNTIGFWLTSPDEDVPTPR
jgi:hypothetical protein